LDADVHFRTEQRFDIPAMQKTKTVVQKLIKACNRMIKKSEQTVKSFNTKEKDQSKKQKGNQAAVKKA
jgi:hypothetical protein